jgi:hippurate hydrolase
MHFCENIHPNWIEKFKTFEQVRKQLHAHPELAFEEHLTAQTVASQLKSFGYVVTQGVGGTGVVGQLKKGSGTACLGLRADMDALPIQESNDFAWASQHPGRMHACGHDGHTATLLAAAKVIAEDLEFSGTLNLIFQPAEEGAGGALKMIEDGLFERFECDSIFALHNMPGIKAGHFSFKSGSAMASSDNVRVLITGKGGHGAMPHSAQDPIVAASAIVMALQTIVSRNVDPMQCAVITVGSIHAGSANNVIAQTCELQLSVRALDPKVRSHLKARIMGLIEAQSQSFGVGAQVDWTDGYAVLVNSSSETQFAKHLALEVFGSECVVSDPPALTASEDFAFMLERVPGCYFLVGNGESGEHGSCMVHNPGYDFNDEIIVPGATFWVKLVQAYLK